MFSNPMTSPEVFERSLPYRGTTLTTFADSRLTVLATAPPHPASYDFAITRALVPGGPEPNKKGLGNFIPFTVIDKSIALTPEFNSCALKSKVQCPTSKVCLTNETRVQWFKLHKDIGHWTLDRLISLPLRLRKNLAGGRGKTARCCAPRGSCRDPDPPPPARLCRAALPQ